MLCVFNGKAGTRELEEKHRRDTIDATEKVKQMTLEAWANNIRKEGCWGQPWEAAIFAVMLGIEIKILTNLPSGWNPISMKETIIFNKAKELLSLIPKDCPTFYLLHHKLYAAGEPGDHGNFNHYSYLKEVFKCDIPSHAKIISVVNISSPRKTTEDLRTPDVSDKRGKAGNRGKPDGI